jgi:hypothetical protein
MNVVLNMGAPLRTLRNILCTAGTELKGERVCKEA